MAEQSVLNTLGKVTPHVPDLVIYGNLMKKLPCIDNLHGVLLFADVSGFTALTEKFSTANKKGYGADQLTETLNSYMGDIVDHVLVAGGDILNFAGDALLALWKVRWDQLRDVITLAVQCSMRIQEKCGVRATEVGVELRVKIAISAGRLSQIIIGNRKQKFFVVMGRAVDEVRLTEGLAEAGTIILSPNAWELCDRSNIVTEKIPCERAVKLRYIKRKTRFDLEAYLEENGKHLQHEPNAHESLRKVSLLSPNPSLEMTLRKYVMLTVLRKLDDDQPLEYLSEMRPVTILFLNLQFYQSAPIELQSQAIQDATMGILKEISNYRGKINKIFAFDKGCTFLCVFGLPGDKQEDESAQSLCSAFNIHTLCSESIDPVRIASVGVTSGLVFCGVVGHAARHEYTVISRKVNLAARMMMHYPGIVSCDQETCQDSKLPAYLFKELPPKEMKGVASPGTIYQYLGSKEEITIGKAYMTTQRDEKRPLLGREMEIDFFRHTLNEFIHNIDLRWKECQRVVVYEGARGFGKSHILAEINYLAQCEDYRVIAMQLSKMNMGQPLYTIQNLLAIFLRIDVCKGFAERERVLQSKISGNDNTKNLCLFNSIFLVKFAITDEVSLMDEAVKHKEMEKLMIRILQQAAETETIVCIIDDAKYIDAASWSILSEITDAVPMFLVMALCPFRHENQINSAAAHVLRSPHTVYLQLKELHLSVIPDIARHSLGVISMPGELEMLLIERSHGVPYYLNELLKSLCSNKILVLEPVEQDEVDNRQEQARSYSQVQQGKEKPRSLSKGMNARRVMSLVPGQAEERLFSCKLNEAVNLQNISLPYPLKGIALSQLDNMTAAQQIVVKCAAVIGQKFSTVLLNHILPEGARSKLQLTLNSLVKSHILECATKAKDQDERSRALTQTQLCRCPTDAPQVGERGWAPWWDFGAPLEQWPCRVMHFCTPLLQETAYELWLQEQSRSLHHKCATFLEPHAHRCHQCGGASFIYGHSLAQSLQISESLQGAETETSDDVAEQARPVASPKSEDPLPTEEPVDHNEFETTQKCSTESDPMTQKPPGDISAHTAAAQLPLSDTTSGLEPPCITIHEKRRLRPRIQWCNQVPSAAVEPGMEPVFSQRTDWSLQELESRDPSSLVGCRCDKILESVVSALTQHWMAVGNRAKTIYYLLESAAAAVHISNNYLALSILNKVESLLTDRKKGEEWEQESRAAISHFETGCVYGLKGEVLFNLGQVEAAESLLRKSLWYLQIWFPSSLAGAAVALVVEKARNNLSHRCRRQAQELRPVEASRLPVICQQIRMLSLLWKIHSAWGGIAGHVRALLAAKLEVSCAESTNDQSKIIQAYIDYVQCCQRLRRRRSCERLTAT